MDQNLCDWMGEWNLVTTKSTGQIYNSTLLIDKQDNRQISGSGSFPLQQGYSIAYTFQMTGLLQDPKGSFAEMVYTWSDGGGKSIFRVQLSSDLSKLSGDWETGVNNYGTAKGERQNFHED